MTGPIYFGGLKVDSRTNISIYATVKEDLQKRIQEQWKQEVHNILKFIKDSKLDMPLMTEILSSAATEVLIQEYREHNAA